MRPPLHTHSTLACLLDADPLDSLSQIIARAHLGVQRHLAYRRGQRETAACARCRDRARSREAVARGCGRSVSWRAQGASAALAPNVWLRLVLCRAHACPPPCGFRGALLQLDVRRSRCIREHMHVWCRCRAGLPVACESYAASAEHMCKCLLYVPVASRWGSSLVSQPNYMKERVERVVRPSQAQSV